MDNGKFILDKHYKMLALVAQLDVRPTGNYEVAGSTPTGSATQSFMEIDHEIFSTVILSLPLIHEGQLSVSGKRMYTIYWLTA